MLLFKDPSTQKLLQTDKKLNTEYPFHSFLLLRIHSCGFHTRIYLWVHKAFGTYRIAASAYSFKPEKRKKYVLHIRVISRV